MELETRCLELQDRVQELQARPPASAEGAAPPAAAAGADELEGLTADVARLQTALINAVTAKEAVQVSCGTLGCCSWHFAEGVFLCVCLCSDGLPWSQLAYAPCVLHCHVHRPSWRLRFRNCIRQSRVLKLSWQRSMVAARRQTLRPTSSSACMLRSGDDCWKNSTTSARQQRH